MRSKPNVTLVVPVYNEANRLNQQGYIEKLAELKNVSILLVNDGSTDGTDQIISDLVRKGCVSSLVLSKNSGKGEAVRHGMNFSCKNFNSDYVGFLDCDGAFSVDTVTSFLQEASNAFDSRSTNVVISSRVKLSGRNINRSPARHYFSRILITIISYRIENLPYDSQSGLKLFRKSKVLEEALEKEFRTRWFFDIELLFRGDWLDKNEVWELPVNSWSEVSGSHLSWRKAPKLLRELFIILRRQLH
jgi:glycosyltransferase involved in cell wall biosynthesis